MKKLSILFVMAIVSLNGMAQKQTLDIYKTVPLPPMDGITLVTVKKATFNIYEKPNGKRRAEEWGAPGEFIKNEGPSLFGAKMHPTGWAYIFSGSESGFASPKDFQKANLTPFKEWMFNTAEASFNDGHFINTWRIGVNKATGLGLKIWGIEKSRQHLGIGRVKDNALVVILNTILIEPKYQESQTSINIIQKKDESDNVYYEVIYGKNNSIKTNRGIRLNLETIPEAILAKLFLPVNEGFGEYREIVKDWKDIEYSQWDGIDYYNDAVNAELMSAPFVNEQAAINAFKATAPANQTGSSSAAPSTKQRTHMEFLGLEMGGNPAKFIQELRQKGFKNGSGFSQDKTQVFLSGMVYGMQSEICVYTEGNRVNSVSVINMVDTKTAAVNRCNRFKKEISALYGGKWTTPYDGAAELTLPYGKVKYEYGMFDSGVYELSMFIIDTGTSAPAPQQTQDQSSYNSTNDLFNFCNQLARIKDVNKTEQELITKGYSKLSDDGDDIKYISSDNKQKITVCRKEKRGADVKYISINIDNTTIQDATNKLAQIGYQMNGKELNKKTTSGTKVYYYDLYRFVNQTTKVVITVFKYDNGSSSWYFDFYAP